MDYLGEPRQPTSEGQYCTLIVSYTFHKDDIVSFPLVAWIPAAYEQALRDEFDQLYEEVFAGLAEARAVIERWRRDYNPASWRPSRYVVEENRFG